jgi:hypothetical protein
MRRTKTILLLTAATLALAATAVHEAREAAGPALPVVPPTVTAEPGPTPAVPKPARPMTTLSLDGQDVSFPAATLTVTRTRGGPHAILATDDPPEAIGSDYAGNSYMFDMRLTPSERAANDLTQTPWEWSEATSSDATGIFLHGDRDTLQPTPGVRVTFQNDGPALMAVISGPFLKLDGHDPAAAPERVQVYGCVRCLAAER